MFYVGQVVYSESMKMPAIFLGRQWNYVDKDYELSHHIFCDGELVDGWEFCDLATLVNKSGSIHRGEHATDRLTGRKTSSMIDEKELTLYLKEIEGKINDKKLTVFSLSSPDND
jgi:hypothetical protein